MSKSKSVIPLPCSDTDPLFEDVHWSNKFDIDNYSGDFIKFAAELSSLTDVNEFCYEQQSVLHALKRKDVLKNQAKVLNKYLKHPKKYLTPDIDFLSLFFNCSKNSTVQTLLNDLTNVKTKAMQRTLTVKRAADLGKVNKSKRYYDSDVTYETRFTLAIFGNKFKQIQLYLTSPNDEKRACRIDLIPSRFSTFELLIIFSHIRSVLKNRVYSQFINSALCQRIDIAFNMPGLSQLFLYVNHEKNKKIKAGECLPRSVVAQTTYLGDRKQGSHYIIYDKLLKELKQHAKKYSWNAEKSSQILSKCVPTSRVERRHYFNRKPLPLTNLSSVKLDFKNVYFFNPMALGELSNGQLEALIVNKSLRSAENADSCVWKVLLSASAKLKKKTIRLKSTWFEEEKVRIVNELISTLYLHNPSSKVSTETLERYIEFWKQSSTSAIFNYVPQIVEKVDPATPDISKRSALNSKLPMTIVYGGAGTGKTHLLVQKIRKIKNSQPKTDKSIICLAYTNDACTEIRKRLPPKIRADHSVNISTFTTWCSNILRENFPRYANFTFQDNDTAKEKFKEILETQSTKLSSEKVTRLKSHFEQSLTEGKDVIRRIKSQEGNSDAERMTEIVKKYESYKKKGRKWDFNDVLTLVDKALTNRDFAKTIQSTTSHILLDEMQDSNGIQLRILLKLCEANVLIFMVGDICQTIYQFRGSKSSLIKNIERKLRVRTARLTRQHRASESILKLTNFVRGLVDRSASLLVTCNENIGMQPIFKRCENIRAVGIWLNSYLLDTKICSNTKILVRTKYQRDHLRDNLRTILNSENIITMHSAKGIECDNCIVIDPRFSNSMSDTRQEYLNLMYVALTRPSKNLIIVSKNTDAHFYKDGGIDDENVLDIIEKVPDLCEIVR